MRRWRILSNSQADAEYERVELQLLQLEAALIYLDRASLTKDVAWINVATALARQVSARSFDVIGQLCASSLQEQRHRQLLQTLGERLNGSA